ncbi:YcaO-like family protein [Seohaeicola saemankumensis]|nr:YcaO-like family protein [Seohaeicola saemankumensis]MCA0869668.1 YcaO-like family protein [Seohaeicola saemankumensis]
MSERTVNVVFRMKERVKAIRAFRNPYAPGVHVVAAQLRPHGDRVDPRPVFVAGKGYCEADAMTRMLGEAAERDAVLKRLGDETRPLMNARGRTIGTVAASRVLQQGSARDPGSHGCSTHNQMHRAITTAVNELIERRAVMLWWHGGIGAARLPADLLAELRISSRLRDMRDGALEVRQTDLFRLEYPGPVHVIAARSRDLQGAQTAVAFAAGTDIALTADRALLELLSVEVETSDLAHARQTGQTVARDSARGLVAARQAAFETTHRDLFGDGPARFPEPPETGLSIDAILDIYRDRGEEILLADLTRPEIGLPTCRAYFRETALQPRFPGGFALSPL